MSEDAHLLLIEHDVADLGSQLTSRSSGTVTLVQQLGETTANLLRRISERTQDLRKGGYVLAAAYFVLGSGPKEQLESRVAIASALIPILDPACGTLHLVTGPRTDQSTPFQVADRLRERGNGFRLDMHFLGDASAAFPIGPSKRSSTRAISRLVDVA